jgi:hypothetical protein
MSDDSLSNLGYSSIISYISFCLIFFTLKFVYFAEDSASWMILFIVLSFIIQLMNNLAITANKNVCGTTNVTFAMYHTAVPWICVFAVTALCLLSFPGWLRIFSNTFGLYAAQAYGLQTLISEIFTNTEKSFASEKAAKSGSIPDIQLLKAIDSIYSSPTTIINELDPRTVKKNFVDQSQINSFSEDQQRMFYDFVLTKENMPPKYSLKNLEPGQTRELLEWGSLSKIIPNFVRMPDQSKIRELYRMTLLKDTVGYFFWFVFVGMLSSMISVNSILSTPCNSNKKSAFDIIFNKV